ncbi:MAG TPA: restriction endonuclease subunit S, partial [Clostridiales bacterium]|nr:restriction endonuclease subunit S [Clostridiales bacterium]
VVSIGNYSVRGKYINNNNYISKNFKENISSYILDKEDLTMILNDKTSKGNIIGKVLYIDEKDGYVFNQRTMRLKCKKTVNPLFLYYSINSDKAHTNILNKAKPGTQIYINTDDVLSVQVDIPMDIKEQKAIAEILSDMDSEIEALNKKLVKYKKIKQGMMEELLTGRIRLV